MNTVTTTRLPATDTVGQRIVAKGGGRQRTFPWDWALSVKANHGEAAWNLLDSQDELDSWAHANAQGSVSVIETDTGYTFTK